MRKGNVKLNPPQKMFVFGPNKNCERNSQIILIVVRLEEMEQTVCCLRAELEKITRTCTKEREEHR